MTKEEFRKLTENILILDGATGSNLMASGMPRGICTETWVIDHKDIIQDLQRAYIQAGSQVIYAPTFGGNSINLEKHGLRDKIEEINRTLVGYSKELAGSGIYVAGDITTSGSFITADGDYTYTEAYNMYQEQIRILADAGIDLIAAETMINIEETLAAVDAAASVCDLPIMCTMTVEADGSIFSGGNAVEAAVSPKGVINQFGFFGLPDDTAWLGNPKTALGTLIALGVWQFGSSMLIFWRPLKHPVKLL